MTVTPDIPDKNQIRDWWSRQAANTTGEPGVLPLAGSTPIGQLYRQQEEWLVFRSMIRLNPSMRVLELGCGAGRWALRIAPHVRHVTGVDLSPEMIRVAQDRQSAQRLDNIDFLVGAAEEYISDGKFDLIYLSSVDQYLEDVAFCRMVEHVRSMLAPGGALIDRVTIRDGARAYVSLESGYWAIHRTFSELDRPFADAGLVFRARRPSNNPFIRLPYKITSRSWCLSTVGLLLQVYPKPACFLLEQCTKWMDSRRPIERAKVWTSHDFLRYDLLTPSKP